MRATLGYSQSYPTLTRQIRDRQLRPHCEACTVAKRRPVAVIEHPPGEEIQWDWLELPDRRRRGASVRRRCCWSARSRTAVPSEDAEARVAELVVGIREGDRDRTVHAHACRSADPARASEVEVRFLAESGTRTRVELEHRHLDRHGDGWEGLAMGVGDASGWTLYLDRFAAAVGDAA